MCAAFVVHDDEHRPRLPRSRAMLIKNGEMMRTEFSFTGLAEPAVWPARRVDARVMATPQLTPVCNP
jgi:hypothetical protein